MHRPIATLSFLGALVAGACSTVTERTLSDAPSGGSAGVATGGAKGGAAGSSGGALGGKTGGSAGSSTRAGATGVSGGTGKGGTPGGGAGQGDSGRESGGITSGSAGEAGATTGAGGSLGDGGASGTGGTSAGGSATAGHGNDGDAGAGGAPGTVSFGTPFAVAASFDGPIAVAATSTAVVWLESNGVELCPAAGCGTNASKHIVPVGLKDAPVVNGLALALDSTYAYWLAGTIDDVAVKRCPFTGCPTEPSVFVDPLQGLPFEGLLVADNKLYAHTIESSHSCPLSGCSRSSHEELLVLDAVHLYMTADDAGLYYSFDGEDHGTDYCAFADCPPDTTAPLLSMQGPIAAWNGHVFVLSNGTLSTCPKSGCTNVPTPLAPALSNVTALAADASGVYWTIGGASGGVYRCELPACEGGPVTVAPNQANPTSLALNSGYVYWVTSTSVMASKKP